MERLFPSVLLGCIGEGRPPDPQETTTLAEKIWREAISYRPQGDPRQALAAATVALIGQLQPSPDWREVATAGASLDRRMARRAATVSTCT